MHVSASRRHAITDGSFLSGRPSRQTSQAPRHSVDTQTAGRARDAEARGRDGSEGPRTRRAHAHVEESRAQHRDCEQPEASKCTPHGLPTKAHGLAHEAARAGGKGRWVPPGTGRRGLPPVLDTCHSMLSVVVT